MTPKYLLSAGGILLALVLCVFYIFADVLRTPLLQEAPRLEVEMTRTGGLFEGSLATYRGVRVGKVTSLDLGEQGITAVVELAGGTKIPRDSAVRVRSLSPVGEQYLDFQPRSESGPYFSDGDTVSADTVDLPLTLGRVSITLDKLMQQIDPQQVRTVLTEVSTGLDGVEKDMRVLLRDGSELLRTFDESWPVTRRVLRNGNVLLRVGADHSADIATIAQSSKLFAAWLRDFDPTFFRLLDRAPGQVEEFRRLVRDTAERLPELLDPAVTLTDVLAAHDPHIRALLVHFPRGFNTLAAALRNGAGHLDVIFQKTETCRYPTTERSPRDTTRRPLQDQGRCPRSSPISQRGAQWAPGPVGR
jgi:virulence factor Mce-like protein